VVKTGGVDKIRANGDSIYVLQGTASCYAHTELFPYFEEEPTITLTDEELLAECERRGVSTKITK